MLGLAGLSYLLLSFLAYWPVGPFDQHHLVDCVCGDPVQEVWFLDWMRFAVVHGHNPFITHFMIAPTGANLALNTSFPLLGVLALPITTTLGPVAAYNFMLRLALALSAFSMFAVLRRYTSWLPAAYFGGLLFGFSPYMIGHAHRHLFLTFLPLLPVFIPLVDDWLVSRRANPWRAGAVIGLVAAAEFLISPEIVMTVALAVVLGLVVIGLSRPREVLDRFGVLWRGVVTAIGAFFLVAGVPAYLLLAGPYRPVGAIHSAESLAPFSGDLLAPVVGTRAQFLTPARLAVVGDRFTNRSIEENGFYLGLALVVLLLVLAFRGRRSLLLRAAFVVGVVAFVLGLGSTLKVRGHTVLSQMPFRIFTKVPILENLEPARLSLYVQTAAAIVLAVGLDIAWVSRRQSADGGGHRRRPDARAAGLLAVTVVSLAFLVPTVPLPTGVVRVPSFFTTSAVKRVPQDALALTFPYDRAPANVPMVWQVESKMRFRIFGGEAFVPAPNGVSTYRIRPPAPPDISAILLSGTADHPGRPPMSASAIADVRTFCRTYHVTVALVDPNAKFADDVRLIFTRALGSAPRIEGDMYVWLDVPGAVARD
ncbi:MAG TPA: hypothetical protein VGN18_13935 [Jatrophihabitans sp.]|uniref:hypothetical protein n=1 Tax=Jatrophihabitans sp. TaxID=1932789 RepID=UPI002DFB7A74|nr:hypothetical protein [Jatrophihabitans sp.]